MMKMKKIEQIETKIENGDCLEILKKYPDNPAQVLKAKLIMLGVKA